VAYAYGTNAGIGAVAQGDHGHRESDIRYVARRYFTLEGARAVAVELANATVAARQSGIWGESTTTVALSCRGTSLTVGRPSLPGLIRARASPEPQV
jgi:hypothetical protein